MHSLTEALTRSHEERLVAGGARRADVQQALRDTRQQMAVRRGARLEETVALRRACAEDAAARRAGVASTLADFGRARTEMAASQRSALAQATADRQADVRGLAASAQQALRDIHTARSASAAALHAELGRGREDLAQRVGAFLDDTRAARTARAAEQRQALRQGHAALAVPRASLQIAVATILEGFHTARQALAQDLAASQQTWHRFAHTMQARRAGVASNFPAPRMEAAPVMAEAAETAQVAAEQPTPPETAEGEATPAAGEEATFASPRVASEDTIFSYLADHPDGVRLAELQEHFGTSRQRLTQILYRLSEENRARKDDERGLYFAT
ncbi:MAG: hypothetical protein HY689_13750 [Chloroflexi bacterium]|nr:hypothetical protein [Chloroflexota bacterium]